MAETMEKNKQSQGRDLERSQQASETTRSRDYDNFPSLFDLHGGELFAMRPSLFLRQLSNEMDRMLSAASPASAESHGGSWWPAIEVSHNEGNLNICAEIPGLKPEDVKVEVSDNDLVIRGERKQEHKDTRRGFYRSERSYGQFFRRIRLPEGANADEAKANFSSGELRITIPVAESKRRHREITIGSGESNKQPTHKT